MDGWVGGREQQKGLVHENDRDPWPLWGLKALF